MAKRNKRNKKNKKNKKQGENNMANTWGNIYNIGKRALGFQAKKRPEDSKDPNTLNLVLFKQQFLNNLAARCLPNAGSSEFQTHYRAVQVIVQDKEQPMHRLVFTIPTIFFNFSQTVTSGSVDFDLREVAQISASKKNESLQMAQKIASVFPSTFFEGLGFEVSVREAEIGSIHRHPGDFSFSSIDLDKNPDNPGVIYRQAEAKDHIQTDSVMYITGQGESTHVKLVTTQTRIVNVQQVPNNGGIEGTYARAKTIALILKDENEAAAQVAKQQEAVFNFARFFKEDVKEIQEVQEHISDFLARYDHISEEQAKEFIDQAAMVFKIVLANNYSPQDQNDPQKITQRHVSYGYSGYSRYGGTKKSRSGRYDPKLKRWVWEDDETPKYQSNRSLLIDDDDDDDIELDPRDMDFETASAGLGYFPEEHSYKDVMQDEKLLREFFWNCCGNNQEVTIKCKDGEVKLKDLSKNSSIFQVFVYDYIGTQNAPRLNRSKYVTKGVCGNDYFIELEPVDTTSDEQAGTETEVFLDFDQEGEDEIDKLTKQFKIEDFQLGDWEKFKEAFVKEYGRFPDFDTVRDAVKQDGLRKVFTMYDNKYDLYGISFKTYIEGDDSLPQDQYSIHVQSSDDDEDAVEVVVESPESRVTTTVPLTTEKTKHLLDQLANVSYE